MRAMGIRSFGDYKLLETLDVPMPQIRSQDVLIQVKTAGIGMWDVKVRENQDGMGEAELPFPIILGWECAGVIVQVGAQVTDFNEGDEVLAYAYQCGSYGEYVAVPETSVTRKPKGLGFEQAAALPVNGNTAHQAVFDELMLNPNETVLITGAAGSTGLLAIQFASRLGAHVIAATSRHNHDFVVTLGADEVICYDEENFVTAIRQQHPSGIDAVLECVDEHNLFQSVKVLKPGGRLISIVTWNQRLPLPPDITARYIVGEISGARLAKIAAMTDKGNLHVYVQRMFPLEQCREAHKLLEQRHGRGKIILRVSV